MILRLAFPIDPRPKQRAQVSVLDKSGQVRTKLDRLGRPRQAALAWTPEATRLYEQEIRVRAQGELNRLHLRKPLFPSPQAVFVAQTFWLPRPRSGVASTLELPTAGRNVPDLDNLIKAVWDALNRVLWTDDKQVIHGPPTKLWAEPPATPRVTMAVADLEGMAELVRSEGESVIRAVSRLSGPGVASSAASQ